MPAYTDWDAYGTSALNRYHTSFGTPEMNLATTLTNESGQANPSGIPLLGTGTMRLRVQSGTLLVIPKSPGGLATERGLVAGKCRTVLRWNDQGGVSRWGLTAMQSVLNLTSVSGNAYVCLFDTLSFNNRIHLGKMSATTLGSWTTLASSSAAQFVDDTPLAVEFEWNASAGDACSLVIRTGTATDFSNLGVLLTHTDLSSPFVTSVAEGLFGVQVSGSVDVYFDNTTIYKRL